jgi:hypothetical protein
VLVDAPLDRSLLPLHFGASLIFSFRRPLFLVLVASEVVLHELDLGLFDEILGFDKLSRHHAFQLRLDHLSQL